MIQSFSRIYFYADNMKDAKKLEIVIGQLQIILKKKGLYVNIGISSAYDNDVKLIMEIIKSGHNIEYLNNDKNNNFEGMFKRFKKSLHPKNPLRNFKYIDLRESSLHYLIIKVRDFYRD